MADKIPVKATYSGSDVVGLAEYLTGETVPVANGGTGTTTSTGTGSVVLSNSPTITGLSTNSFAITDSSIVFEGATADAYETTLFITDPTADRTVTFQDLTGTVGLSTNKLSFFSSTTSAELAGVISDETGSGVLVFGTSPNFTTSVTTGSASFDAFNTNATTVNAFGAATTLAIGNATTSTVTLRPGTLVGSNTTQNVYNTTATTVNAFGAATTLAIGGGSGTLTIGNATITGTNATSLNLNGASPSITTTSTATASVFNTNATTGNLFGAATTVSIGASSGTATIANATLTLSNATTLNINGASPTLASTSTGTLTLFNTGLTTVNAFGAATTITLGYSSTAASTINISTGAVAAATTKTVNIGTGGAASSTTNVNIGASAGGTTTLNSPTVVGASATQALFNTVATTLNVGGAATTVSIGAATGTTTINNANTVVTGDLAVNGGDITTSATTFNLLNTTATTLNVGGAATAVSIGAGSGNTTVNNNLIVSGNLTVNGSTTTVNSTTITVDDPIFILGGDTAPSSDDNLDRGVEFRWHNGTTAKLGFFGYDDSTGYFTFIPDATDTAGVLSGTQGDFQASNFRGNLVGGTVSGTTGSFSSTLAATGDFAINTNKFTVIAASGNTSVGGTLGVTGATTLSSTLGVTGNTTLSGTLGVTGATTLSSTLAVTSDFSVATSKFTVASASGNTAVAGTLGVTGATTLSSTLGVTGAATLSSTLGVTGAITGSSTVTGTQLISNIATGTAPLTVTSTTMVTNLNVDYLDGQHGSYYTTAGNLSGTIPSAVLGNSTHYIGTTAVALNRASANLALTGISSVTLPGSTSGTVQIIPAAVAGTGTVLTLPATTGTVVTTGDSGTVTSTMIADGTIVNADINASAAIADTKLATISTAGKVSNSATTATNANTASAIVARDASGNFTAGTITAALTGNATSATNIASGAANQIPYQTGSGATAFITAPTVSSTVLKWTGYAFTWGSASGLQTTDNLQITNLGLGQAAAAQGAPDNLSGNLRANTISINNAGTYRTTFTTPTLTAHRTLTVPDVSGNIVTTGDTGTVTSTMIADGTIVNADISASAAIAISKLAASTISGISLGSNLATLTLGVSGTGLSGSATYNGSGAATFTVTSNATSANTASAIVARDASGNFSAGTITATISGSISGGTVSGSTLTSTVATGTAPLTVTSTTVVSNLNADLWDGNHFASYLNQAVLTTSNVQLASLGIGTAASGTAGEIRATNAITSYYSDDRLKTRTGNIENALDKVLSLNGFHYTANETAQALGYDGNKQEVGLSAQEVQAVLPEVIAPAPIDPQYMTLHYERLVPLLIEAIKEQQKQIEELKAKVGN